MTEQIRKIKKLTGIDKIVEVSGAFKLLSDPTRLKILCLLFDNRDGLCVSDIAKQVKISHSATSHQLLKLEARSVVESFREGQMICYCIVKSSETDSLERMVNMFRKR